MQRTRLYLPPKSSQIIINQSFLTVHNFTDHLLLQEEILKQKTQLGRWKRATSEDRHNGRRLSPKTSWQCVDKTLPVYSVTYCIRQVTE